MLILFLCASSNVVDANSPLFSCPETPANQCTRLIKELLITKDYNSSDKVKINVLTSVLKSELENSADKGVSLASVLQAAAQTVELVKYLQQYKDGNPEANELLITLQTLQVIQATKYMVNTVSQKTDRGCTCCTQ